VTKVRDSAGLAHLFDTSTDARGQRAMRTRDLPFPTLRHLLATRGPVRMSASLAVEGLADGRLFLPAAPYLLHRMPFAQRITASHEMAETVAAAILGAK
jgi:hypothetical protein